jgi:secreted trypsin-like serine protease
MTRYRFVWGSLRVTLAATLVATVVSLLAFVQSEPAARAVEDQVEAQHLGGRVIGGTEVPNGKHPFVAALLNTRQGNTPTEQQFCGGSLIDSDSVLTAAHCFNHIGVEPQPIRVTVGRTVLSSTQGQERSVSKISIHPSYDPPTTESAYDVAVLQLGSAVEGVPHMRLADASDDSLETPGHDATVAGWGNTIAQPPQGPSAGVSHPDRMHEAQVPIVSDAQANMEVGDGYHEALMIAAGTEGRDTCQGDSGGPLFDQAAGVYTQIGIVSFGNGCGALANPGVYTEVNNPSIRGFIVKAAG